MRESTSQRAVTTFWFASTQHPDIRHGHISFLLLSFFFAACARKTRLSSAFSWTRFKVLKPSRDRRLSFFSSILSSSSIWMFLRPNASSRLRVRHVHVVSTVNQWRLSLVGHRMMAMQRGCRRPEGLDHQNIRERSSSCLQPLRLRR